MGSLAPFSLTDALQAIGVAEVFVGDPLVTPTDADGMKSLGATEGNITVSLPQEQNRLTAPELTGGVTHQATTTLGEVLARVPVIMGDPTLYQRISPTSGQASGGYSRPQKVREMGVLIIPRQEVGGGLAWDTAAVGANKWARVAGNGVAAATGADAAPKFAVWFWRATVSFADLPYAYANGGKVIVEVTFHAMFDGSKPEGHKVYTIGDPYAAIDQDTLVATPIPAIPIA